MTTMHTGNAQKGVTLLESLLGILLFSIGILAVVGLQTLAIRTVAESKYRVDASFLANEVVGQMWVDRTNIANYAYDGNGTPPGPLVGWVDRVTNALPGVAANKPTVEIAAGNVITITVFWQHPEEANLSPPPPPHQFRVITSIN